MTNSFVNLLFNYLMYKLHLTYKLYIYIKLKMKHLNTYTRMTHARTQMFHFK